MKPAKKYDLVFLKKVVEDCDSFRELGKFLKIGGKTAKSAVLRYGINYDHFKHKKAYKQLVGNKYGLLTVLEIFQEEKNEDNRTNMWAKCLCDCGKIKNIKAVNVKHKRTTSCGCDRSRYDKITGKKNKGFKGCEDIRSRTWSNIKTRAKKRNIEFSIDIQYGWELFVKQNKKCALSNIPIKFGRCDHNVETTASLDRIDNKKGYIKGNVQWVHKAVNIMKCDLQQDIFIEFCRKISQKFPENGKIGIEKLSENHFISRGKKRKERLKNGLIKKWY
jgi:hypothetical protein